MQRGQRSEVGKAVKRETGKGSSNTGKAVAVAVAGKAGSVKEIAR